MLFYIYEMIVVLSIKFLIFSTLVILPCKIQLIAPYRPEHLILSCLLIYY